MGSSVQASPNLHSFCNHSSCGPFSASRASWFTNGRSGKETEVGKRRSGSGFCAVARGHGGARWVAKEEDTDSRADQTYHAWEYGEGTEQGGSIREMQRQGCEGSVPGVPDGKNQ